MVSEKTAKQVSIVYQLLDITLHNQLSIEQKQCTFKPISSFTQNLPVFATREK